MARLNSSRRTTMTIDYDADNVSLVVIYDCENPQCPEPQHTQHIDDFAEASNFLGLFAKKFLGMAETKGNA